MSFGDLSKQDYWRLKARTQHVKFLSDPAVDEIAVLNEYRTQDGKRVVCREFCRLGFHLLESGYVITWDSRFQSDEAPFYFGDQEEMGLGIRLATSIAVDSENGGEIRDSAGQRNGSEVWGKSSQWCDYSGPVAGENVGVTVLPHPQNFRPSWWHARDYGLIVANPFGRKAFEGGNPSRVDVASGKPFRLRFAIYVHDDQLAEGDADRVLRWYQERDGRQP